MAKVQLEEEINGHKIIIIIFDFGWVELELIGGQNAKLGSIGIGQYSSMASQ